MPTLMVLSTIKKRKIARAKVQHPTILIKCLN